jgi:DNA-binding PadR family transcriptional regulator
LTKSPALKKAEDALRQELRRGTLILAVLAALRRERFGAETIDTLNKAGVQIEAGALYPMLRRLEDQGLLNSERREEGSRVKRFYRVTAEGLQLLQTFMAELAGLTGALKDLMESSDEPA